MVLGYRKLLDEGVVLFDIMEVFKKFLNEHASHATTVMQRIGMENHTDFVCIPSVALPPSVR